LFSFTSQPFSSASVTLPLSLLAVPSIALPLSLLIAPSIALPLSLLVAPSVVLLLPLLVAPSVTLPHALRFSSIFGTDGPNVLWFALASTDGPGVLAHTGTIARTGALTGALPLAGGTTGSC
jgi:hypothetical protein